MSTVTARHIPVLLKEVLEGLKVGAAGTYVDCTVGAGGHAEAILDRLGGRGRLLALDRDSEALREARARLASYDNVDFFHQDFKDLPQLLRDREVKDFQGCLADLGLSSLQLEDASRGFSFQLEGPLDMRMDRRLQTTAADLINRLSGEELTQIFRNYGEEPQARRIASAIMKSRPFTSTTRLAELIARVKGPKPSRIHPATRVFQALRIEVNRELEGLEEFLTAIVDLLKPGGRLAMISFHSLEDRIVKRSFQQLAGRCNCFKPRHLCTCPRIKKASILTRKPLTASPEEVSENPRSRSAKLRVLERVSENNKAERGVFNG